jgi:hypothetical protein
MVLNRNRSQFRKLAEKSSSCRFPSLPNPLSSEIAKVENLPNPLPTQIAEVELSRVPVWHEQ